MWVLGGCAADKKRPAAAWENADKPAVLGHSCLAIPRRAPSVIGLPPDVSPCQASATGTQSVPCSAGVRPLVAATSNTRGVPRNASARGRRRARLTSLRQGRDSSAGCPAGASRDEVKGREDDGIMQRDEGLRGVRLWGLQLGDPGDPLLRRQRGRRLCLRRVAHLLRRAAGAQAIRAVRGWSAEARTLTPARTPSRRCRKRPRR
jgi:hypothetical protein